MLESSTRLAQEVITEVEEFFANERRTDGLWSEAITFETKIRRNIRLAEAPSHGQTIFQYAGTSHGAEDYRQLSLEVQEQTTLLPAQPDWPLLSNLDE
jgi:chromosome partitioning protein